VNDRTERHPIALKAVRYTLPGTDAVTIRSDVPYKGGDPELVLDIYAGSGPDSGTPRPVVVVAAGYRDVGVTLRLGCRFKEMGMSVSWARLIAASGMVAITYSTRDPETDLPAVLQYVREHAPSLGVSERIGLFAASANVVVALSALMLDPDLKCAALLYGFTLDSDGSTAVADAAKAFGFVNACAGRSVDDLPARTPLFVARAGEDQFPGLNQALDRFVTRALQRNLPIALVNYATGAHGFDLDDDSGGSQEVIRQILGFFRFRLLGS
jgi:hypothetical protein